MSAYRDHANAVVNLLDLLVIGQSQFVAGSILLASWYTDRTASRNAIGTIPDGEVRAQVATYPDRLDVEDSNANRAPVMVSDVTIIRKLTSHWWDERLYAEDAMPTMMGELLDRSTWRNLGTVRDIADEPELTLAPERSGRIITFRTRVGCWLA